MHYGMESMKNYKPMAADTWNNSAMSIFLELWKLEAAIILHNMIWWCQ